MALFSSAQIDKINKVAEKSKELVKQPTKQVKSMSSDIDMMSAQVEEYFKDSEAILITTEQELSDYIDKAIASGYCGIDTETTGLDRIKDTIVGSSLYYPGGVECYIPNKHLIPIFDDLRKNQLTYEQCGRQFQKLVDAGTKMIFANADFDIAMLYKDYGVDFNWPSCYYDVILAWRCIKENELHNGLKELYNKYVLRGKGDPKKFTDFFSVDLFPYCKPEIAKLYAANDAKITYELFVWQFPYVNKEDPKCQKAGLQKIADLVWGIEFPMIRVCAMMHRTGSYIDSDVAKSINTRYDKKYEEEIQKLRGMVQVLIDERDTVINSKRPFKSGKEFNPTSVTHARYLVYNLLNVPVPTSGKDKGKQATSKEVLAELNLPEINQLLKVRSLSTLITTFVKKLPRAVTSDSRIHAQFRSVGAATGRMCIAEGTKITCLNGQKNIEDLEKGDLVYCYDGTGNLHLSPVKDIWLTGENRECVKIKWQSSGSGDIGELICTPDHRILKKDGSWCRADKLTRHTEVAHLRRTRGSAPEYRPCLYGWNEMFTREQDVVKSDIFHAPSSMIVHHKDEVPSNNDLSNLELMTPSDHCSHHAKVMQQRGVLKAETLYCEENQKKAHATLRRNYVERIKASKDQLLQKIKDVNGRISYIDGDYENFKLKCEIAGIDIDEECRKYDTRYHKRRITKDEFVQVYEQFEGLAIRIIEYFNISYDKFYKYCDEYGISRNHTVQSVEPCGTYTVYDIEVEYYHNFIANEICVHNSSAEPNLQNIPSHATDIRHMFRATAAQDEFRDLKHIDGTDTFSVEISKFDSVYKLDDSLVKIYDINEGDEISVAGDSNDPSGYIVAIEKDSRDVCKRKLILKNSSDKNLKIHVRTAEYVMIGSDYSQQEPKLLSYCISDPNMMKAFSEGKDIYATIAGLAFNQPYEKCLEFHPETHEYQPDGKRMRGEAKTIVLGICYGRSTVTIGEQLFGTRDDMSDEDKTNEAQKIYDAVLNAFPNLRTGMLNAQNMARHLGYVETILGRRRHIPDMTLPEFEFKALPGYVNPDVDPLDVNTLENNDEIPKRIIQQLQEEYSHFKYNGQIYKRNNELYEQKIKVINNRKKITDASRQCLNSVIQGSAAELTKMAILALFNNEEWAELGGRLLIPVHDELICEAPIENWGRAGQVLAEVMSQAGDFLPFTISCDVETSQRWYGLEYPCPYTEPKSLDNMSEDEIKWVQYHLIENEYTLPVYKDENGEKPRGDAAKGVNGIESEEMKIVIDDYQKKFRITRDQFIEHIKTKVTSGILI